MTADERPLILRSRVPPSAAGRTLLAFLSARFRYHDEAGWQRELAAGRLQLDGHPARGDEVVRPHQRLRYEKLHREPPVEKAFRVVETDGAFIAVDKPAHLPMHADGPFIRNTLISLLRRDGCRAEACSYVHRLDRETSGVVRRSCADKAVQATHPEAVRRRRRARSSTSRSCTAVSEQGFVATEAIAPLAMRPTAP